MIVNVVTVLYARVYAVIMIMDLGSGKLVKRLNPWINHLLSMYTGQSHLIKYVTLPLFTV